MPAPSAIPPGMAGAQAFSVPAGTLPPPHRHTGLIVGVVVAAVLVIVAVGTFVVLGGRSDSHSVASDSTGQTAVVTDTSPLGSRETGSDREALDAAPPTSGLPSAGNPILSGGIDDPDDSIGVVQGYATTLAHHDWNRARAVNPDPRQGDADLQGSFGALGESTVIATSVTGGQVTGAYLAWETVEGAKQTSVYCASWTVDTTSRIVTSTTGVPQHSAAWADWVIPDDVAAQVVAMCP